MSIALVRGFFSLFITLCLAGLAQANPGAEVYVNGVPVGGVLKGQTFEGATVRFDEAGRVHITAPGFTIERVAGGGAKARAPANVAAPARAGAAGQYWLVIETRAMGHYSVQVQLNGAEVGRVDGHEAQAVLDISRHVRVGENQAEVVFMPLPAAPRVPPMQAVEVMIGRGDQAAGQTLSIDQVMGTVKKQTGERSATSMPIRFSTHTP